MDQMAVGGRAWALSGVVATSAERGKLAERSFETSSKSSSSLREGTLGVRRGWNGRDLSRNKRIFHAFSRYYASARFRWDARGSRGGKKRRACPASRRSPFRGKISPAKKCFLKETATLHRSKSFIYAYLVAFPSILIFANAFNSTAHSHDVLMGQIRGAARRTSVDFIKAEEKKWTISLARLSARQSPEDATNRMMYCNYYENVCTLWMRN